MTLEQASRILRPKVCLPSLPCEMVLDPAFGIAEYIDDSKTGKVRNKLDIKKWRQDRPSAEIFFVRGIGNAACDVEDPKVHKVLGCYYQETANDLGVVFVDVTDDDFEVAGILAHEWGHRRTLPHTKNSRALMWCYSRPKYFPGPKSVDISDDEWLTLIDPLVNRYNKLRESCD